MSTSETTEINAQVTALGVGLIATSVIVTLFVLWATEPMRKVMPLCVNTFSQLCSYLGGNMTIVYLVIFGLVMPASGILLIVRDIEPVTNRK
jgi:hypothetical protein